MDTVKELMKVNWRETSVRLAGYAAFRARNLAWRTGNSEALAKGMMPDDIASQAILSVVSGERTWEPERGPLLPYLKRVVDSLLNHLAESHDNRRLERFELPETPAVLEAAAIAEPDDQRIEQLFTAAEDKPELIEVLTAMIEFEEIRPRFLAIRIGKPVSHVNNCFKRLRRLALKISAAGGDNAVSGGASMSP